MSKCSTGGVTECRMQMLEFWEYLHIPPQTDYLSKVFDKIKQSEIALVGTKPDREGPGLELAYGKWIYFFTEENGKITEYQEVFFSIGGCNESAPLQNGKDFFEKICDAVNSSINPNSSEPPKGSTNKPANVQKYQFTPRDSNGNTKLTQDRWPEPEEKSGWSVNLSATTWLFLSQDQISKERFSAYITDLPLLKTRAFSISAQSIPPSTNQYKPIKCYLFDPIEIAQQLSIRYGNALDKVKTFEGNKENTSGAVLFNLVEARAALQPEIKNPGDISNSWLKWAEFEKRLKPLADLERLVTRALTDAESYLCEWKQGMYFRAAMWDLYGNEIDGEKGIDKIPTLTMRTEIKYLAWELAQKDSWYKEVMNTSKMEYGNRFQFFRKTTTAYYAGPKAAIDAKLLKFVDHVILGILIGATSTSNLSIKNKTALHIAAISEIDDLLLRKKWMDFLFQKYTTHTAHTSDLIPRREPIRTPTQGAPLATHVGETNRSSVSIGHFLYSKYYGKYKSDLRDEYDRMIWNETAKDIPAMKERIKNRSAWIKSIPPVAKFIFLGIETVNLYYAGEDAFESPNAKTGVNLAGSFCDAAGAIEFLLVNGDDSTVFLKKTLGKDLAEKVAKNAGKFLLRAAIVGAIADGVGATSGYMESYGNRQYGLAAANYTIIISSTLTLGALTASALSATATEGVVLTGGAAVFAGLAWPLTVCAAVYFAVGAAAVWYFSESQLQSWCYDSQWGNGITHPPINPARSFSDELEDLLNILFTPKINCFITNGNDYARWLTINFELTPLYIEDKTQIHFVLNLQNPGSLNILPDHTITETFKPKQGLVKESDNKFFWQFSKSFKELGLPEHFGNSPDSPTSKTLSNHAGPVSYLLRYVYDPQGKLTKPELDKKLGPKIDGNITNHMMA